MIAGGCGSLPHAPLYPKGAPRQAPPGIAVDQPWNGALRPGDELELTIDNVTPEPVTVTVDAVGQLHVATGQDIAVAGLTLPQAEAKITEALQKRDRFAQAHIHRSSRNTHFVHVTGALREAGRIELSPAMRVLDAIAAAGGLAASTSASHGGVPVPLANLRAAVVLRDGSALPIDMALALQAQPRHNVYLHPGDSIFVPYAGGEMVTVFGQVTTAMVMPHHEGLRMSEALTAAGGLAKGADKSDIRLLRGPVEAPKVYRANFSAVQAGNDHDVVLAPGDIVYVEDDPGEDAGEVLGLATAFAPLALVAATLAILTM